MEHATESTVLMAGTVFPTKYASGVAGATASVSSIGTSCSGGSIVSHGTSSVMDWVPVFVSLADGIAIFIRLQGLACTILVLVVRHFFTNREQN